MKKPTVSMVQHFSRVWLAISVLSFSCLLLMRCSPGEGGEDGGEKCLTAKDCPVLLKSCLTTPCICRAGACVPRTNNPPNADAGRDQEVKVKEKVFLDGGGSFDPDGDAFTFSWTFVSKPEGSKSELENPKTRTASFSPDVAGDYVIRLEVADAQSKATDEVKITVKRAANNAPKAKMGSDQSVNVGATVTLDGSGSSDPDGDKLTFSWKLEIPTGSKATLSDAAAEKPTFVADIEGEYKVTLEVSDGEKTDSVTGKVQAAKDADKKPSIDSLDPTRVPTGVFSTVKIVGKQFVQGAVVLFRSREIAPKQTSETELIVDFDLIGVTAGKYPVVVKNPNNQQSNPVELEVFVVPEPVITTLSPEKAGSGAAFTLTVTGSNFVNGSEVYFTGTTLPTTYKSDTSLEAKLDLTGISTGIYPVRVRNPGGKDSNVANFEVTIPPPPPEITIINPEEAKAGAPIDFTVFGKRFNQGSAILFDGKPIPTQFVGVGELRADPKLDLTQVVGGVYKVGVIDNQGYKSTTVDFTVLDQFPPPQLTSVSPTSGVTQSITKVTITGTRFDAKAIVYLEGTAAKTSTYVSATQLTADLDLQTVQPGAYKLWVENPAPPGQTKARKSNELAFTVAPLPAPSISSVKNSPLYNGIQGTIEITGQGFTPTTVFQFTTQGTSASTSRCNSTYLPDTYFVDQTTKFISSTQLQATFTMPTTATSTANYYFGIRAKRGTQFSNIYCVIVNYSGAPTDPILTVLNPVAVNSGTTSPVKVILSGNYFEPFSVVYFNKKQVATVTYLSSASLDAMFDISGLAEGAYDVQVENSTGKKTAVLTFSILKAGQPLLSTISPTSVYAGTTYNLTLTGTGFDPKATVEAGGNPVPGTVVVNSATQIVVNSAVFKAQAQGSVPIVVVNPGGLKSNPVSLSVLLYPKPVLSSISPNSFEEGSTATQITVSGSSFLSGTSYFVLSNNKKFTCTYSSSARLYCNNVDFSGLSQGTETCSIENPDGQSSATINFTITAPNPPTLSSLSPSTAFNNQVVTLTVTGSRLAAASKLVFGTKIVPVTFVSSSQITAQVDLNGMAQGIVQVKVRNTVAGKDYDSNASNFIVLEPPTPVIKYVSPMFGIKGTKFLVSIVGTDFNPGSKVLFNNVAQTIKSNTATSLSVELDASQLNKGAYSLLVDNGGGKKSEITYIAATDPPAPDISELRPAGVSQSLNNTTVTLYGKDFDPKAVVTVKGSPVAVSSITATQITFSVPFPSQLYPANSKVEVRVTNPDSQSSAGYIYVMDPSAPLITYVTPISAVINSTVAALDIYGGPNLSAVTLYVDGQTTSYSYRTSYIRVSSFAVGNQARNVELKMQVGAYTSNPYFFKVTPEPAPVISYLEPPFAKKGSTVNLLIRGANFKTSPLPTIRIDGQDYTASSSGSSSTTLSISIPLTNFTTGAKALQVRNPDYQFSETLYFHITP